MTHFLLRARLATALTLVLFVSRPILAQNIEISSVDARSSWVGPSRMFTGAAVIDPLFGQNDARRMGASVVTFMPGARTAWHSHPAGQTLVVTEGVGWVQERSGERMEICVGDVVWTPPGVEHWHGGTDEHKWSTSRSRKPSKVR
jgi:quercetin dioxygenase-like cupin family protein